MTRSTPYEIDLAKEAEKDPGIRIFASAISTAFEDGVLVRDPYIGDTIQTQTLTVPMGGIATFGSLLLEKPDTSIINGIHSGAKIEDIAKVGIGFIGDIYVPKDSDQLRVGNLGILAKGIINNRGQDSDFTVRHAVFPGQDGDTYSSFYARYSPQLWGVAVALDLGVEELPKVSKAYVDWSTRQARIGWTTVDL